MYRPRLGDRVWFEISGLPLGSLQHFCGVRVCRGDESASSLIFQTAREPVVVWDTPVADKQAEKDKLAKIAGVILGCRLVWDTEGRDFCTVTEVLEEPKEDLKAIADASTDKDDEREFSLGILRWAKVIRDRAEERSVPTA